MRREMWVRALRSGPVLAALGAVLTGCGLPPSDGYYSGGGSHYSSPSHHRSRSHHRDNGHHKPRPESRSQQQLQQHWMNQAQRPR